MSVTAKVRQLLAFMFRHDYQCVGGKIERGEMVSLMACDKCGKTTEFITLDRASFHVIFWERGCKGLAALAASPPSGGSK